MTFLKFITQQVKCFTWCSFHTLPFLDGLLNSLLTTNFKKILMLHMVHMLLYGCICCICSLRRVNFHHSVNLLLTLNSLSPERWPHVLSNQIFPIHININCSLYLLTQISVILSHIYVHSLHLLLLPLKHNIKIILPFKVLQLVVYIPFGRISRQHITNKRVGSPVGTKIVDRCREHWVLPVSIEYRYLQTRIGRLKVKRLGGYWHS